MKSNEQNSKPENVAEVMRRLQVRICNVAMHHFGKIDARTLCMLKKLDLYNKEAKPIGANIELEVLLDPKHHRREKLPVGPLVLYTTKDSPLQNMVVELPILIFSEKQAIRKAALECLDRLRESDPLCITPKTDNILKEHRTTLLSEDLKIWRDAAVAIGDALYDDLLVALCGTRQCLARDPVIQQSLDFYVPKILSPSVSSLDSIELAINNSKKDPEFLGKLINKLVAGAGNLQELCSAYYKDLGFLPFASQFSMAEAVAQWMKTHPDTKNAWQDVWKWVGSEKGPIPRYHACCIFVLLPYLVPKGKLRDLWKEILNVVYESSAKGSKNAKHATWALRRDLAKHYAYHLEACLPDSDGTNVACFAWWFAEQVARLFPDNVDSVKFYHEKWVKQALELSTHAWLASGPHTKESFLRYMTLTMSSPWAVALLTLMGKHLDKLAPGNLSNKIKEEFNEALMSGLVSYLPFPVEDKDKPIFAAECSLVPIIQKWSKHQSKDYQQASKKLIETSRTLRKIDGLCVALRKLDKSVLADQVAISLAVKAKAYMDPASIDSIWEIFADVNWRKNVLAIVDPRVQNLIIEAMAMLRVEDREKWIQAPHYIAELCEKTADQERRRILFLYVIYASLATDTVSAVQRLLRGDQRAQFAEYAKDFCERVEAMRTIYPPWVVSKLRGLIANMHVV